MKQIGKKIWFFSLFLFVVTTFLSWWSRHDLYDQQAAQRWSEEDNFAQLSCFYPIGMEPTEYEFQSLYHSIEVALKNASIEKESEAAKLFVDAYSITGSMALSTNNATMEVKVVGVTDDFFLFHPMKLLEGSYFDENMLMKDGIILDEEAAFILYGSNDVVGMPIYIGGMPYYIRGVVEREKGYLAKAAGLDVSHCYVPIETLLNYGQVEGSYTYETLLPNPVDGFAENILMNALNETDGKLEVIENSKRYSSQSRKEILYDFAIRSMSSNGIIYPYWENIARSKEDICAALYLVQMVTFIVSVSMAVRYIWKCYKNKKWNVITLLEKLCILIEKLKKSRRRKRIRIKDKE